MLKTSLSGILLIFAATSAAAETMPTPEQADVAWIAEGEFCEPETVLALPDDTLLVSNVCDFREQGNGFLTLLAGNGDVIAWKHVENLDAPLGMALVNEKVFVVDNNQVKIFSWPDFEILETIKLEMTVANDLAVTPDETIYVTDTAKNFVMRVDGDRNQEWLTGKDQFPGANGIAVKGQYLFVGGQRLWKVDLETESIKTIGPEWLADIDGIEFEENEVLQVTPVGGPLVRLLANGETQILGGEGVGSANHGYAPSLGLALIPTGFDNQVIAIRLAN